ncbi:MAG: AsmA family protein [Burkholderiaceae bacterium]
MIKKVVLGLVVLFLLTGLGLFVWARSVLGTDAVRNALAAQMSTTLGQPVTVESVSATIFPRLTVQLKGVAIGTDGAIKVDTLDVGSNLRALLSRRIEAAALHIDGATLNLPLPPFAFGDAPAAESSAPVHLGSIDEVVLSNIQIVSRGRTLRGDIDVVPHGMSAVTIRRIALVADGARIDGSGEITDLAGPVGTIDLKAGALDLDQLMAFAADFSDGSGVTATGAAVTGGATAATTPSTADLTVTLAADRATMGGIAIDRVAARAHLKGEAVTVDPLTFNLLDGTYVGTLAATLGITPSFGWKAALKNVDVAALTAYAGSPGLITGRMSADIDLVGNGIDAATAMKTARGTARLTMVNGVVKKLALVRSAVAATSLNPQSVIAAAQGQAVDEPFSEMGGSLSIAAGTASTPDLHFISKDIRLDAGGALKLDGSGVSLQGIIQLSEALSKQANPAIVRALQDNGKITLPAIVRGTAQKYQIEIDTTALARRALTTEAKTQATDAVKRGLGGLLRR